VNFWELLLATFAFFRGFDEGCCGKTIMAMPSGPQANLAGLFHSVSFAAMNPSISWQFRLFCRRACMSPGRFGLTQSEAALKL
jgi:hypothetical protein